jgi:hypothetical protein
MNDPGERYHFRKLFNVRIAIVEVGIAETNEKAWLRHLTTYPEDHNINVSPDQTVYNGRKFP